MGITSIIPAIVPISSAIKILLIATSVNYKFIFSGLFQVRLLNGWHKHRVQAFCAKVFVTFHGAFSKIRKILLLFCFLSFEFAHASGKYPDVRGAGR
jgi:hypothetical protein